MAAETADLLPVDPIELAQLAESDAARAAVPLAKWPRQLVELLDCARAALLRAGVDAETADAHPRIMLQSMAELHGGRSFNLPKGVALANALRDDAIWRDMGRAPVETIAARCDPPLTIQRVYQIYAEQRELRRQQAQPGLF